MTVFGVDLSDFDRGRGPVDVAAMARDGISFLTHKATEGTSVTHRYYAKTLNDARAAGIPFLGAYMVPRTPGNGGAGSVGAQVSYFLSYLDAQTPWWRTFDGFFLQVDTEHWGYDNVSPSVGAQACSLLRQQTGKWVIHYAPRWAYGDTIPGSDPLWASSYGANPAVPYRQAYPGDNASAWSPYSGRTPTFVQFGSKLTIGTQPGCDADAYPGTLDQLRPLITGGTDVAQLDDIQTTETDDYWWSRATMTGRGKDGKPMQDTWDGAVIPGTRQLGEKLDGLAAHVAGLAPAAATQDQVNAAMLAALKDPAVINALGAAVASHIHVS